ncbi:MAG: sigma-70 family RNA polymerase sigma factor [Verrucomicrobiaceae bacterium]|nr:sigma-70 family RNA polymerase sigma factor [Verrucomicrobiaceae bacterium]
MSESPALNTRYSTFHTTRWTRVCAAKSDTEDGRRALADLCDAYYEPVVAFLRCELRDADAAREMAHSFFAEVLKGSAFDSAESQRGRFRSYLLGAVKHFLMRQRLHASRAKRGGGVEHCALDAEAAMNTHDGSNPTADMAFDRQWALTVLDRALDALQKDYERRCKGHLFEALHPWLDGDTEHGEQRALASRLGRNLNTLKVDISRIRLRFREHVRAEVAGTVYEGRSITEEMEMLLSILRGG